VGLNEDCEMVLLKEWEVKASHTTYRKYGQTIKGVRVFGGEFVVASGAHGGVLHAHGQPLLLGDASELKWDVLSSKQFDLKTTLLPVSAHIYKFYSGELGGINLVNPVEPVIHNSLVAVAKQGVSRLAYYVNGNVMVGSMFLAFDAFVDMETGELLEFLDKSTEVSPFKSPIPDPVYVYDQYLKDYNDDFIYDDDFYHPDPDRYSNVTLVFNSSVDTYPTADWELNELVDNTLYVKYLYYSLSDGTYESWNMTETDWNIEYNLTIANAYFDGTWGIHFGSGYITDDVISHEWSHGYVILAYHNDFSLLIHL
jgi:Zn-dependent metalloprotease